MNTNLKHLVEKISQSEVLGHLTEEVRLELAGLAIRKSLKKGEVICLQGDDCRFVLYIASGALRSVITAPDAREYEVSRWGAGAEFWSHTLLDDDPMPSTLEAAQTTVIYRWAGETALELVLRNPAATRRLLHRQTQLIRKRRENIYNLAFNPVAGRLAKLVIEKFINAESSTVQRDLTLEDMGAMIASSPEVICRILYQFQSDGYLKVNRASITLHNREALERLAGAE